MAGRHRLPRFIPHAPPGTIARRRDHDLLLRSAYWATGLPEASVTFVFHCLRISAVTDAGSEM
ncbi:hypothetical protein Bpla01_52470 [Burkholderia plantarii]|nr:hypothetical protein Bpla01_52470 [Burkholderia plantarii]